jgi:hypothetical protein
MARPALMTLALATFGMLASAAAQTPENSCGDRITVQRGDTLSRIAERCNVSERALIRLNPRIEGSRDLRVGMEIAVRGSGAATGGALDRFGSMAGEAAGALSDFARDLGSSAEDLLEKNPDLRQRLEGMGQRLRGVLGPSPEKSGPAQAGEIAVSRHEVAAGESLEITAKGLPENTQVSVGAGAPQGAYDVVQTARTDAAGTLKLAVRMPDWVAELRSVVVLVAAQDGSWSIRSEPVRVTGAKL